MIRLHVLSLKRAGEYLIGKCCLFLRNISGVYNGDAFFFNTFL